MPPANVIELRCTADLDSKPAAPTAGRKVKGTIHWVSAAHAIDAEVRLYDRLFTVPEPDADGRFQERSSTRTHSKWSRAKCEPSLEGGRSRRCAISSSASAISRSIRIQQARQAGLQPHDHAEGHLGEGSRT